MIMRGRFRIKISQIAYLIIPIILILNEPTQFLPT